MAHEVLLEGLDTIQSSLQDASLARKIEIGSVLWELGNRVKTVMDDIKEDVRQAAVAELGGQVGQVTLDGDDMGSATVTVLAASLRVPKEKDVDSVKSVLGSRFPFFFEEIVSYKPHKEFESRVEKVDNTLEQKTLLEAVERTELTPRVNFRRDRPPRRTQ